ncbi:FAD-binding oxidoreductase [Rhizobium sp. CNPSo 3464]|uniref:NAD(P)/FAD-dependent oxidoreductase n=1 Tax=Rhizobium sp. CNPSo 3464 TaxID=3021406 RepID=UPI00254CFC9F|nr:FAD-binding oxidoreductase [Rhizobium sp. CNPSo 3464]MDK4740498.1 FAD-binding oxidoreductase [Rhizobium sp. CNPSo 3464]
MLNDPKSHGLWETSAPPAPITEELNDDAHADVVIVGGGYTGFSAAIHLAKLGIKSVLLEAVEVGFGGSGRNVGLINGGMWVMPDDIPGVLGPQYGERCLKLLSDAPVLVRQVIEEHEISCQLEKNGTLHLGVGRKGLEELETRHRQWTARGAPLQLLDSDETRRRTGSAVYSGALFDPRAGTLQPLAYVRGLARAAITSGVKVYTKSPVLAVERRADDWRVATRRGSVTCKWIVVATDAYSTGPWKIVREEQVHLPYFNFATKPLSDNVRKTILPNREGCWDTKEILSSFRMDQRGRLVFGSVGALRNTGHAIHESWAKRSLKRVFPQLGDVEFESAWYGKIGMTSDAVPRFHKFENNVVGFSGYNGRGIAPGTTFGKVLASYIAGNIDDAGLPLPITEPKSDPLRMAKEAYYEMGAQVAHLAGARL